MDSFKQADNNHVPTKMQGLWRLANACLVGNYASRIRVKIFKSPRHKASLKAARGLGVL